jgi:hypothetical protein
MDSLPIDCLNLVCKNITYSFEDEIVRTAASIALVGNKTMTQLSHMLWEKVQPGCHKESAKLYVKKVKEWKQFQSVYEEEFKKLSTPLERYTVNQTSKLKELIVICELLHIPKSGTKAKLLENINIAYEKQEEQRKRQLETITKKYNTSPKQSACPVSSQYIENVISNRKRKIVSSTAKQDYLLNDKDMTHIQCEYVKNPHYSCAAPMRLYCIVDVERYAVKKFGSYVAFTNEKKARTIRNLQRQNTVRKNKQEKRQRFLEYLQQNNVEYREVCDYSEQADELYEKCDIDGLLGCVNRYYKLKSALSQKQCILHNDSKLCKMYIEGETEHTLEEVVETMEEMKFLFTHTNYKLLRDQIAEKLSEEQRRYEGYVDWEDVNLLASAEAKKIAMHSWIQGQQKHQMPCISVPLRLTTLCQHEQ